MAERQQPAEPTRETVNAMAASQSQRGSARPSVPSALPTREPRTWGIATAAPSAHSRSAPAARLLLLTLRPCKDPTFLTGIDAIREGLIGWAYERRNRRRAPPHRRGRSGRAGGRRGTGRPPRPGPLPPPGG